MTQKIQFKQTEEGLVKVPTVTLTVWDASEGMTLEKALECGNNSQITCTEEEYELVAKGIEAGSLEYREDMVVSFSRNADEEIFLQGSTWGMPKKEAVFADEMKKITVKITATYEMEILESELPAIENLPVNILIGDDDVGGDWDIKVIDKSDRGEA